ncbi:MAG: uridine kinase [Verrucomicrobiota bacterium]|nr:uridine kinase [Verrucomicrobiota bacterium]
MAIPLPKVVAIAGGSCAGKSWLAEHLQKRLEIPSARLSLDSFYRDRAGLTPAELARVNFDDPCAIEWPLVEKALHHFLHRERVCAPRYQFKTHSRAEQPELIEPGEILFLEGLWVLSQESIRSLCALKIFISAEADLCLDRRIARDIAERGRTEKEICAQFHNTVRPMHDRFVEPQKNYADIVLQAPISPREIEKILNRIKELSKNQNL